jgi:hypothetical protein
VILVMVLTVMELFTLNKDDWHGKCTAKAAWKLGFITRKQFEEIRAAAKEKLRKEEKS